MDTVEEIKSSVAKLSRGELSAFRNWFQEYEALTNIMRIK